MIPGLMFKTLTNRNLLFQFLPGLLLLINQAGNSEARQFDLLKLQNGLKLNSTWIEESWASARGLEIAREHLPLDGHALQTSDRFAIVKYVLSRVPETNKVYPSEQYFYFQFPLKERLISGNFRFCESPKGLVHFGYFDVFDRNCSYHGSLSNGLDGISVECENDCVQIRIDDIKRSFVFVKPRLERIPDLLEGERLISPVLDESGFNFALVFSQNPPRFIFMLDGGAAVPDRLCPISVGDFQFFIGFNSRFVFFNDENRLILCGVLSDNIARNNYFDGPFDQVPPNLEIKSEIESVYPYVKLRGGIDNHGNFVEQRGVRVAISPYIVYSDTSEFLKEVSRRHELAKKNKTSLLTELVYEWKTDFSPPSTQQFKPAPPGASPSPAMSQ